MGKKPVHSTKVAKAGAKHTAPAIEAHSLSRRDWGVRAIEHTSFANALDWLALRSFQSWRHGSDSDFRRIPWPNDQLETGLASIYGNVVNIRRAVEQRTRHLKDQKYAGAIYELLVLLETLVSLAEAHRSRAAAYQRRGQRFGRPLSQEAQMRETWKELGLELASKRRKAPGRKRSIDINNEQLDLLVREAQDRPGIDTVIEACRFIASRSLEEAGKLPSSEWQKKPLVELESRRLASRHSKFRRGRPQGSEAS
jgi:hypothetical protein